MLLDFVVGMVFVVEFGKLFGMCKNGEFMWCDVM